jgi:hypothetical protein
VTIFTRDVRVTFLRRTISPDSLPFPVEEYQDPGKPLDDSILLCFILKKLAVQLLFFLHFFLLRSNGFSRFPPLVQTRLIAG